MASILVVEDDTDFYIVLETFLQKQGHGVTRAANPEEFLMAATNRPPDLIIMDMQFPGGGAPYATKLMQSSRSLVAVPIIFCSAMTLEHMQHWFPATPQRRYQKKPADLNLLKAQIQELLPQTAAAKPSAAPSRQAPLARIFEEEIAKTGKKDPNGTATRLADVILADALRAGASDIHFDPFKNSVYVRYRVDGDIKDQVSYPKEALPIVARLRIMAGLAPLATANPSPEEGSFEISSDTIQARARLSSYPSGYGDKLVIRVLNMGQNYLALESLGFAPDDLEKIKELMQRPNGLFLVCGVTGSGKTTTLCSMLQILGQKQLNIMTIEDPIEYQLTRVVHTQISPKIGLNFPEALRYMMRQDPNVIMVGEVRDRETAEIALQAAMTGHMIYSTIHTTNAPSVVARLLGMGIEPYMISSFLIGALAQRLVRKVCSQCAEPASPSSALVDAVMKATPAPYAQSMQSLLHGAGKKFVVGKGCPACSSTGFKGRVGIFELLLMNSEIRSLIVRKPGTEELFQAAIKSGMKTLLMDAVAKAAVGWTSLEEAVRFAL